MYQLIASPLLISFAVCCLFSVPASLGAQSDHQDMRVFLDCEFCDLAYIKQEFTAISYVRHQQDADVHVLVTRQSTASGGRSFEVQFIGKGDFSDLNNQLHYSTEPKEAATEQRQAFLHILRLGMVPYLSRSDSHLITISIQSPEADSTEERQVQDPWKNWVYEVEANGNMDIESLRKSHRFRTSMSADHVTEAWRLRIRVYSSYNRSVIRGDQEIYESIRKNQGGWSSVAYSLGDHWSVGASANYHQDSYQNLDHQAGIAPALEYSLFPYQEVMRREFTIAYRLKGLYQDYQVETIYGKMSEALVQQELRVDLRMRQAWGQLFSGLSGAHVIHDPEKFRLSLDSHIDLRLIRGLSLRVSSNIRLIRDQLSLPSGGSSLEDLLLQQRQLATDYDLGLYAGVSYTFGSIYNNIVNTRL